MSEARTDLTRLVDLARPTWNLFTKQVVSLRNTARHAWRDIRNRHEHLMDTDPRYPVALAAGGTAVITLLVTNPAIAKALGVLLANLLNVPHGPSGGATRPDPYRSRGIPHPRPFDPEPWPRDRTSQALWEQDGWDNEE